MADTGQGILGPIRHGEAGLYNPVAGSFGMRVPACGLDLRPAARGLPGANAL